MDQIFRMLEDSGQSRQPRNPMVYAPFQHTTRFQLSGIEKVIAQLEEDEKRRKMQLMEDEELAVAFMVGSFAETGKGAISQPDASSVSPSQGFALPQYENVSISQLEDVKRHRSSQLMEDEQLAIALQESLKVKSSDQLKRFQLSGIEKVVAQLEEDEKRRKMQLMEDEELAVAFMVGSFAETGKGAISQPDASSVSLGQGFALPQYENVSISQQEDVERRCSSQLMEDEQLAIALQESLKVKSSDQLKRFQLSGIEKVVAQLEEDEKRRKMQLMEDEELAVAFMVGSFAETGKGAISQPDASSFSPGQGFALPQYENVSISQLENVERRRSSQLMEDEQLAIALQESLKVESPDQLKRFQLSGIEKVVAQLEEDERRRKMQLMEDEELAVAFMVGSFAETGKGAISQPDASSVSLDQGFALPQYENVSIPQQEDVERRRSSQLMEDEQLAIALQESLKVKSSDQLKRFQLSGIEKVVAQLEEDERRRKMQLMEDEELAMAFMVGSFAETGKGAISQPDASSVSPSQGFALPQYENVSIPQQEDVERRRSSQLMEDEQLAIALQESLKVKSSDQLKRFQLSGIEKVVAQLEEDERRRKMQLMEDEELAMAFMVGSFAETGKGAISQPDASSVSPSQGFALPQYENVSIPQQEDVERRRSSQLMEDEQLAIALQESLKVKSSDQLKRFQLSGIEKVVAQLEEDERRQKMQLMEDEELAVAFMVGSFAETGKGAISQPDASSVSPDQGFALPQYENVSIPQQEDVERRHSSQLMEDEQLAIPLQESLKVESPDQLKRICAGCNSFGHGQFLNRMDTIWHSECFCCHECGLKIVDEKFSDSGKKPYHSTCHEELFHPKCEVCKNHIPTKAKYKFHRFWKRKYCPLHDEDETPRCCSCKRLEPKDMKYLSLDDGRKLCIECSESAIKDTFECQPLYREIQEFFEDLDMKIEQHIPLHLVEQEVLNDAKKGLKKGNHDLPETRGLTVVEENEVTAILVLNGLPRLLLGNILAHEMMHSWLRLKGYHDLSLLVEEGICQVMAYLWLEYEIAKNTTCNSIASSSASSSSSSSESTGIWTDVQRKLADCFRNEIETHDSPIYGKGFKLANNAVVNYGLEGTLSHIQKTGSFPS